MASTSSDVIRGNREAELILGDAGDDTIYGGGDIVVADDGDDTIYGDLGNDLIYGNSGNDLLHGDSESAFYGSRVDPVHDTIYGGFGFDSIYGNEGNDYLAGGGGIAHPEDEADFIAGGLGADFIVGNGGNDTLIGDNDAGDTVGGDDILYGGLGDDLIYGSKGYDALVGQQGNDTMGGGIGKDSFFIFSNNGQDVILDFDDPDAATYNNAARFGFETNEEWRDDFLVIERNINGTEIDTFEELQASSSVIDGNLVFNLGDGNSLTLNGVTSIGAEDVRWWDAGDKVANHTLYYSDTSICLTCNREQIGYRGLDHYEIRDNEVVERASQGTDYYIFNEDNSGSRIGDPNGTFYVQNFIDGTEVDTFDELMALNTSTSGRGYTFQFPESQFSIVTIGDEFTLQESQFVFYGQYDYLS